MSKSTTAAPSGRACARRAERGGAGHDGELGLYLMGWESMGYHPRVQLDGPPISAKAFFMARAVAATASSAGSFLRASLNGSARTGPS